MHLGLFDLVECWDFSTGLPGFHKGILICGWLSESMFLWGWGWGDEGKSPILPSRDITLQIWKFFTIISSILIQSYSLFPLLCVSWWYKCWILCFCPTGLWKYEYFLFSLDFLCCPELVILWWVLKLPDFILWTFSYYVLRFWILLYFLFWLAFWTPTLVEERRIAFLYYCQMEVEVQVPHLVSIDIWRKATAYYCWGKWEFWLSIWSPLTQMWGGLTTYGWWQKSQFFIKPYLIVS